LCLSGVYVCVYVCACMRFYQKNRLIVQHMPQDFAQFFWLNSLKPALTHCDWEIPLQ
jgi:hypothetical protein